MTNTAIQHYKEWLEATKGGEFTDPQLYAKTSVENRREVMRALASCWHCLQWSPAENVLDFGCGTGECLYHAILPTLPADFNKLVGVDISQQMVNYAASKFSHPRLNFQVMDICTKKDPLLFFDKEIQETGGFHKIISMFCVHWIKDKRLMLENLNRLLVPGGYALLYFMVRHGMFPVWDKMALSEKWSEYFPYNEVKPPFNEYVYRDDYRKQFSESAQQAGFSVLVCEDHERKDAFVAYTNTDEGLMMRMSSVDPLLRYIPDDRKQEYLRDLLALVKEEVSPLGPRDYTGLVVLLRKPLDGCPERPVIHQ